MGMERRFSIVIGALLALALARYIILAFYVHPFADDFSYAVAGMRTELLPRLWDEYNLWNGRWFSNIMVLRGPLAVSYTHLDVYKRQSFHQDQQT